MTPDFHQENAEKRRLVVNVGIAALNVQKRNLSGLKKSLRYYRRMVSDRQTTCSSNSTLKEALRQW